MGKHRLGFQPSKRHIFVTPEEGGIDYCKTCIEEERKRRREQRKEAERAS